MQRLLKDAQKFSGVKYDLNNLADVYEAIHVIQENLDITGTTAKEAASTISGSAASMKAAFHNVLGNLALGEDIIPSLQALVSTTSTFLFGNLLPAVGNVISGIPTVISTMITSSVPIILEQGANLLTAMSDLGGNMVSEMDGGLLSNLPEAIRSVGDIITGMIGRFMESFPEFVSNGVEILGNLISGILDATPDVVAAIGDVALSVTDEIMEHFPEFLEKGSEILSNVITGITEKIPEVVASITDVITNIATEFQSHLPEWIEDGKEVVGNVASGLSENAASAITAIGDIIADMIGNFMDALPDFLDQGMDLIGSAAQGIIDNTPTILKAIVDVLIKMIGKIASHLPMFLQKGISMIGEIAAGLIQAIPDILAKCGEVITEIWNKFTDIDWAEIGRDIIEGIKNGISNMAQSVVDAAKNVGNDIYNAVAGFFGIHSPSTLMRDKIGKNISLGWAEGIEDGELDIKNAMDTLSKMSTRLVKVDLSAEVTGRNASTDSIPGILIQLLEYLRIIAEKDEDQDGKGKINTRELLRWLKENGVVVV